MSTYSFQFLSTPSARRATSQRQALQLLSGYFYPRPPRGGRRPDLEGHVPTNSISIHALREEGDRRPALPDSRKSYFYPRPPRGGRHTRTAKSRWVSYFYPRPPRGGRPLVQCHFHCGKKFLSTPSARRATNPMPPPRRGEFISIHALREEGDSPRHTLFLAGADFYPRPPRGGRRFRRWWAFPR